ncbi:MAG: alpha/beta hydrolase [Pseudomonadota bacterium]
MKIRDAEILIVPGFKNAGPGHWQSRWEQKMPNARRIEQKEWAKPVRDEWVEAIKSEIETTTGPTVLIAHSLGVAAARHAVEDLGPAVTSRRLRGALFVSPPEVTNPKIRPKHLLTFGPYPSTPMPIPSFVIASRNDPFSAFEKAQETAADWGSFFVDAGESGHIDDESGHGPWPEGLMVFAEFMKRL